MAGVQEINSTIDQSSKFSGEQGGGLHIALTDGSYIQVKAGAINLEADEQDFRTKEGILAFQNTLQKNLDKLNGYQKALMQHLGKLVTEVKRVEAKLAHDLGVDPNEINMDLAAEIASLASSQTVSLTMKQALDAQQVHCLLKDPLQ